MPKPTKTALGKHPRAVILLSKLVTQSAATDHDFEWFDTMKGVEAFMAEAIEYAAKDVEEEGDLHHALIEVTGTTANPIEIGAVHVFSRDTEFATKWKAEIEADTNLAVAPSPTRTVRVKPTVKGKKPSQAAAVLNTDAEAEGADAMAAKAAKSADLKKRLAEKKQATVKAATTEVTPVPKPRPSPATVNAMRRKALSA